MSTHPLIAAPAVRELAEIVVSTVACLIAGRLIGPEYVIVSKADVDAVTQRGKAPAPEVLNRLRLALA